MNAEKPKQSKTMGILVYVMLGLYAVTRLLDIFLVNQFEFGAPGTPTYSIFYSAKLFIAYQVWGVLMCGVAIYAIHQKQRILIYVSMLILMILFFYPYFTKI